MLTFHDEIQVLPVNGYNLFLDWRLHSLLFIHRPNFHISSPSSPSFLPIPFSYLIITILLQLLLLMKRFSYTVDNAGYPILKCKMDTKLFSFSGEETVENMKQKADVAEIVNERRDPVLCKGWKKLQNTQKITGGQLCCMC